MLGREELRCLGLEAGIGEAECPDSKMEMRDAETEVMNQQRKKMFRKARVWVGSSRNAYYCIQYSHPKPGCNLNFQLLFLLSKRIYYCIEK